MRNSHYITNIRTIIRIIIHSCRHSCNHIRSKEHMSKLYCLFPFILILSFSFLSCTPGTYEDERFIELANDYVETMLHMFPEYATSLGDHRFDHLLNDYSREGITAAVRFYESYRDSLTALDPDRLTGTNYIDYQILLNRIDLNLHIYENIREHEWNPLRYNIGGAIYNLIARDFAPIDERMADVRHRLEAIPVVLEAARSNLTNPPRVHTETAILQNNGNINMIRNDLEMFIDKVPEMREELDAARGTAVSALREYGEWLENDLLPESDGEFRIGEAHYRVKLSHTLDTDVTMEEILEKAEADLIETQNVMYETALPMYREFFPDVTDASMLEDKKHVIARVLDRLAEDRPTGETIVDQAKEYLEETTEFVKEHELVTVPDDPIRIIVMPEFQRGVAIAYCDPPGPLEEEGETFYAISPPPADWSEERVESYFREYNNYMLKNLTVHEAMPGHYLQLAHSNRFEAPTLIRAIFWSGPFVEGWATYAEQLMVEYGYGGPEVKMQQLKMRLRLIINAIIDQKIHAGNMTEDEAIDLMMTEGFQEEGEAVGKWRRACLTSAQLSTYYVGNIEVNDIRNAYEQKYGNDIDVREMHDTMLSFGSPAPRYVKMLMDLR